MDTDSDKGMEGICRDFYVDAASQCGAALRLTDGGHMLRVEGGRTVGGGRDGRTRVLGRCGELSG